MSAMDRAFPCVTRLKETIHYLGQSPEDVAAALGISARQIYNYMSGKAVVPAALRPKFAAHLQCEQAFLFPHPSEWLLQQLPTSNSVGTPSVSATPARGGQAHDDVAPLSTTSEAICLPLHSETSHLIGRKAWLAGVRDMVQTSPVKKLIILQGPIGIGKSSELTRLASLFLETQDAGYRVIWLSFPAAEATGGPEAALDVLLGILLSAFGIIPLPTEAPRFQRIAVLLTHLEKQNQPIVILLDNAECCLEEHGALAACWEGFLTQFVSSRHLATLLLATKEWHGWPGRESLLVEETSVPPLTLSESVRLLQHLGLKTVPTELLQAVGRRMTGNPLLLEWTARLVTDPLLGDDWHGFDESDSNIEVYAVQENIAKRLQHLLDDPSFFAEQMGNRLSPLLQHLLEKRISDQARQVLTRLSVATIPLGKPALQVLCPHRHLIKELRDTSLLAAYTNRIQVLPVVAWTILQQLTPEQRNEVEDMVIEAYTRWLDEGNMEMQEAGSVVTELAVLLLTHHRLLEAAELLVRRAWLSFHGGSGSRLAQLSREVLGQVQWHQSIEEECAGLALIQTVFPFLGEPLHMQTHGDYERLRAAFLAGELSLSETIERNTAHLLLLDAIYDLRFEQGQAIVDTYCEYLKARHIEHPHRKTELIQEQAFLLSRWCDYLLEQREQERANVMREQAIALYRQCIALFTPLKTSSRLAQSMCKRGIAYASAFLGYHLNLIGRPEEALLMIQQALDLHEQGYGHTRILANSYSEKAQALMALGQFQEALRCDELAMVEIHRWAREGDIHSQEDVWTYQVNRGRLYIRLGRMEEAEQLLQEAEPRLSPSRRNYRMFAKEALEEIEQWRKQSNVSQNQLDWRWVERFRTLTTYDSYWWLTWAGPFTAEEQREWDHLFAPPLDETTKKQLGALMTTSRERELAVALAQEREPCLHYPAIEIEEIRRRIKAQQALDEEIAELEPNVIVKRLYHEAIVDELDYLHLIEATYEGNTERYWECAQRLHPLPSREEMVDALGYVQDLIERGLAALEPALVQATQKFQEYLSIQFHLSPDLLAEAAVFDKKLPVPTDTSSDSERSISAEAAQRFFATVLQESGYEGWLAVLDPYGGMPRVERGARSVFLPDKRYPLEEIRHLFVHELVGHVGYCIAGERSPLGLLGVQIKNCGPIQEGVAFYHERQVLASRGESLNEAGMRLGMLGVGLAAGVITPPQTFRRLCSFFEQLALLNMSLGTSQVELSDEQQQRAHRYALSVCLRKYRGVPDLEQAGVCYLQDVIHLRGLRLIEQAVAADASLLDRLVGVCPLEHLPDLQELGILSAPQPLLRLAYATDLDEYICSFETSTEKGEM